MISMIPTRQAICPHAQSPANVSTYGTSSFHEQRLFPGEISTRGRDHERRRVEGKDVADRRQHEGGDGKRRPARDLLGVPLQHEPERVAKSFRVPFLVTVESHRSARRSNRSQIKRAITWRQVMALEGVDAMWCVYLTCLCLHAHATASQRESIEYAGRWSARTQENTRAVLLSTPAHASGVDRIGTAA
jgi:hypothetical protein